MDKNMRAYFKNTIIIALLSTFISVLVALFAAYGFSRYSFPGRGTLLYSILFTRVLPRVCLLVPFYITLSNLKLVNTYAGLVMVYLIVGMPITIWLLKGYIDELPVEVEESAVIDGCGPFSVIFRIVVPMIAPRTDLHRDVRVYPGVERVPLPAAAGKRIRPRARFPSRSRSTLMIRASNGARCWRLQS